MSVGEPEEAVDRLDEQAVHRNHREHVTECDTQIEIVLACGPLKGAPTEGTPNECVAYERYWQQEVTEHRGTRTSPRGNGENILCTRWHCGHGHSWRSCLRRIIGWVIKLVLIHPNGETSSVSPSGSTFREVALKPVLFRLHKWVQKYTYSYLNIDKSGWLYEYPSSITHQLTEKIKSNCGRIAVFISMFRRLARADFPISSFV